MWHSALTIHKTEWAIIKQHKRIKITLSILKKKNNKKHLYSYSKLLKNLIQEHVKTKEKPSPIFAKSRSLHEIRKMKKYS